MFWLLLQLELHATVGRRRLILYIWSHSRSLLWLRLLLVSKSKLELFKYLDSFVVIPELRQMRLYLFVLLVHLPDFVHEERVLKFGAVDDVPVLVDVHQLL